MIQVSGIFGGNPASILNQISYTGDYLYALKYMDGTLYHLMTLESSGTLTVTGTIVGDVWACGGGGGAAYGDASNGAAGAGGGFTAMAMGVTLASGAVTIGGGSFNGSTNRRGGHGGTDGGNGGDGSTSGSIGGNGGLYGGRNGRGNSVLNDGVSREGGYGGGGGGGPSNNATTRMQYGLPGAVMIRVPV